MRFTPFRSINVTLASELPTARLDTIERSNGRSERVLGVLRVVIQRPWSEKGLGRKTGERKMKI